MNWTTCNRGSYSCYCGPASANGFVIVFGGGDRNSNNSCSSAGCLYSLIYSKCIYPASFVCSELGLRVDVFTGRVIFSVVPSQRYFGHVGWVFCLNQTACASLPTIILGLPHAWADYLPADVALIIFCTHFCKIHISRWFPCLIYRCDYIDLADLVISKKKRPAANVWFIRQVGQSGVISTQNIYWAPSICVALVERMRFMNLESACLRMTKE